MEERPCLLFCDTFHHVDQQDGQPDLIAFPSAYPVIISEIRVIPQGCKVHPQIRDKLGETHPAAFNLKLYAISFAKQSPRTFESLGEFEYEEGKSIQLITNTKIPTNLVFLRGCYRSLTVCIYGTFAKYNQPRPGGEQPIKHPIPVELQPHLPIGAAPIVMASMPQQVHIPAQQPMELHPSVPRHHIPFPAPAAVFPQQSPRDDRRDPREDYRRRRDDDVRDRPRDRGRHDRFDDERRSGGGRRDYNDRDYSNREGSQDRCDDKPRYREERAPSTPPHKSNQDEQSNGPRSLVVSQTGDKESKPPSKPNATGSQIDYEDIESDDDGMLDDFTFDDTTLPEDFDDSNETLASFSLNFIPYQCILDETKTQSTTTAKDNFFGKLVKSFDENSSEPAQVKQLQDYIVSDTEAERDAKWVTKLEELPNVFPAAMAYFHSLAQKMKEKYFVSVLAEWAVFALSMKRARALPLAVNIRFIKAGVKLTTLLADCCEEYQRYLVELDVHEKLIDLLSCEHMASSIKLVVFKALDATTNSAYGMDALFNWTTERACSVKRSVYSRLLVYLLEQTNVRVIAAIKPLLQKAHFYEAAAKLQTVTSRIAMSAPPKPVGNKPAEDQTIEENPTTTNTNAAKEKQKMAVDVDISNQDMSDLLVVIQTIHKTLEHGNNFIRQPSLHSFPTTARLAENSTGEDCYPIILDLLSSRRFLESILVLVSSPLFCETELYSSIRDLLLFLMSNNKGLLYLLSNAEVCNGLIRALLHFSADEAGDLSEMPTLKQYRMNVDTAERCMPHNLGLLLVYHLQAMQEADKLLKKSLQDLEVSEMDDSENVSVLHMLYSMTFSSIGRDSVTSVLSYGPNVMCLLPFLTGGDNFETKMKKSVSSRYAAVLLQMTLKYSEEVHWLSQFKQRLLSIPRKENDKVHDEIHHLVSPLEKLTTFDIHAITPLVEFIKVELEDMKLGTGSPCSVLVCLRLLTRLMQSDVKDSQQVDLQQQLHVIEMFSANAMEIFISLFKKINEQLLLPWKQQQPVSNESCLVLVNMTQHSISLTQSLMQHLLITTFCFKDSRLVQEMFTLHKILCSRPPVGLFATVLAKLHDDIINVLLMFIKGTRQAPESQEAVKKGTWFILLKELLTFLVAKPENFVTGLVLLSELLPTPLPVYSLVELRESEITKVMNERYLCMTNLSCLREELKQMLTTVVGSCCSVLQYYLRRALCQIIDLGSAVATIIIRTLCEMVNEGIAKSEKEEENVEEKKEEESSSSKKFLSGFIYNSFSLLSYLVCQPAGKCVFLQILAETEPETGACQFADFIPKLISVHIRENDFAYLGNNLLPLFRSMCDHEVCMDEQDCDVTAQHLANSLPGHANCVTIVSMLYNMLLDDKHPLPIVLRSLNILESLTDHDYGMSVMKQHLLTQGDCLNVLLARLIKEVEEKKEAPVVYNTVSRFFTYLNLINSSGPDDFMKAAEEMKVDKTEDEEEEEEDVKPDIGSANVEEEKKVNIEDTNNPLKRKIIVNASTLKKIFKFGEKNISDHPMKKLESMLEENSKEDEELSQLCEAVNTFRMILIASVDLESPQEKDESKVVLLPAESAHSQFGGRMKKLLLNNIDDERATTNDWFDEPAPDEIDSDTESDTLKIDLLEIATKFLPAFNFQEEVEKGFVDTTETKRAQRSKRDGFYKAGQHIDDAKRLRFDVSALNSGGGARGGARGSRGGGGRGFYNKPSYNNRGFGGRGGSRGFGGRGRGRGRGAGGNSDIDSFRLRRQNTSRPPSMHVDDFMNMEKGGQTVMAQEGDTSSPQNERFSSSFNSPQHNNTRWTNSFRRSNDGGRNNNYNDNFNQRNYGGGGGGRFHQRSKSDWNNSNYRGGGGRDYRSNRGGGDGGYWNNKSKDDSRFQSSYRNNRGNGNRHQRTFTR